MSPIEIRALELDRNHFSRLYSCPQTSYMFALWEAEREAKQKQTMNCIHCNTEINPPRVEAGYNTCPLCSDAYTKPRRVVFSLDSDGNVEQHPVLDPRPGNIAFDTPEDIDNHLV
jgi:hypothetical protein